MVPIMCSDGIRMSLIFIGIAFANSAVASDAESQRALNDAKCVSAHVSTLREETGITEYLIPAWETRLASSAFSPLNRSARRDPPTTTSLGPKVRPGETIRMPRSVAPYWDLPFARIEPSWGGALFVLHVLPLVPQVMTFLVHVLLQRPSTPNIATA